MGIWGGRYVPKNRNAQPRGLDMHERFILQQCLQRITDLEEVCSEELKEMRGKRGLEQRAQIQHMARAGLLPPEQIQHYISQGLLDPAALEDREPAAAGKKPK